MLKNAILSTTTEHLPKTADQLVKEIHEQFPTIAEKVIVEALIELQNEGKLQFAPKQALSHDFIHFLETNAALWYWVTFAVVIAATASVFAIPEGAYPFVALRYVFGAIFILWLPGYAFIKALFPTELPFRSPNRNLDMIERIVLSFGMSLALVPIVGLLLNYTPWGIRLTPITLSLTALTLAFATAAVVREYQLSRTPPMT
jgi:Protein of unknown function (DUF1616)